MTSRVPFLELFCGFSHRFKIIYTILNKLGINFDPRSKKKMFTMRLLEKVFTAHCPDMRLASLSGTEILEIFSLSLLGVLFPVLGLACC